MESRFNLGLEILLFDRQSKLCVSRMNTCRFNLGLEILLFDRYDWALGRMTGL